MTRMTPADGGFAQEWRKSSYSGNGSEADCVEVATAPDAVRVRDSKCVPGPGLAVTSAAWAAFVAYASER
ncbi:DUF397 domain-containing protein [Streptomyces sp. NPDC048389]|uniref:DUF397 domain-containing protein n=1 Tax=Streptomyces sp. NPDC048389 TaxID=3154622 RepID=UPI003451DEB6